MKRILTFHFPEGGFADGAQAYYLDNDYYPSIARIYAGTAPMVSDAEFEIYRDGVSIMNNRSTLERNILTSQIVSNKVTTSIVLTKDEQQAEIADDLIDQTLEGGAWITCTMTSQGGGKNFTIQLELETVPEELEVDDEDY